MRIPPELLAATLPPWLSRHTQVLEPDATLAFGHAKWSNALVFVEEGEIELEALDGRCVRLQAGAILTFRALALRAVRNPGRVRAVVSGVGKQEASCDVDAAQGEPSEARMTEITRLRAGTIDDLPRLEALWVAVHHRHAESMPELAPYVDDATTWTHRGALYRELLAKPDTVLLLAEAGDVLVGYGLAHVLEVDETWMPDTWVTGTRIGEIESLSVLPAYRDRGIGTQLIDALEAALDALGVADVMLGVLPGNRAAVRMYERRGYRPTWLYMTRLAGR